MAYDSSAPEKSLIDMLVIFDPQQRINVLYLLSALFLAFLSYFTFRNSKDEERPDTSKGFLAYAFPKHVYGHKSAFQDYAFAAVNIVIYYFGIIQLLLTAAACADVMHHFFIAVGGVLEQPILKTPVSKALFTIGSVLAFDFALFWQHYLMHKIPILWHFHKVHHSAEVMTPITLFRMHPLDLVLSGFLSAVFGGTFYGLYWYLSGDKPEEYVILGLNVVIFVFYIFGYNLRHSQIWFRYPAWLSHILVSPAQHQIHHSIQPKHFDKNMGLIFAFWDKLFGTLYVPRKFENLSYGLNRKEPNPFHSVWDLYIAPFRWTWASLKNPKDRQAIFPIVLLIAILGLFFGSMHHLIQSHALKSVHVEDLTWVEIRQALDDGFDTVIIPAGGTEQNGSHMVEGKHNYIVHETADRIAKRLGRTLVAPVLTYVPEGAINPPSDNMRLPGTLSLDAKDYEAVLRDAALSYIQHGFKHVFFIGDSGPNQAPQENVARALQSAWKEKGVAVAQIGDYYGKNGQVDWLQSQGFTAAEIGNHAGIRDTSEMMIVHPQGLRANAPTRDGGMGSNGDYRRATKRIGEKMLNLKVAAAVAQIMPYLKDRAPPATAPAAKTGPEQKANQGAKPPEEKPQGEKLPAEKLNTSDG